MLHARAPADLVGFCGHHGEGDARLAEILRHGYVVARGLMADIHQKQHMPKQRAVLEIAVHHFAPALLFGLVHLGKAVTGKVHQMKGPIDEKDVDQPRFAGGGAGLAQLFAGAQRVDERAFAHVALSHHRKLGKRDRRFLAVLGQAGDEARGFDFHIILLCTCRALPAAERAGAAPAARRR